MSNDFIIKNWAFIQSHRIKRFKVEKYTSLMKDKEVPTGGIFFGTQEFYDSTDLMYRTQNFNGNTRLMMRPYVFSSMPEEGVMAVYLDKSQYRIDEEGEIQGLKGSYEVPVFIFYKK